MVDRPNHRDDVGGDGRRGKVNRRMNTPTDLMTPAQLAEKYPVSRSSLYAACADGLLPHYRVPSRKGSRGKCLIREADFLAWLESNRCEGGPGASVPLVHIKPR